MVLLGEYIRGNILVIHQNKIIPESRSRLPQIWSLGLGRISRKCPMQCYEAAMKCPMQYTVALFSFLLLSLPPPFLNLIEYHLCAGTRSPIVLWGSFWKSKSWWLLTVLLSWLDLSITYRYHGAVSLEIVQRPFGGFAKGKEGGTRP